MEKIRTMRLRWTGHAERAKEEGIPRRARNEKIPEGRAKRRMKLRWSDVVERDMEKRRLTYDSYTDAQDRSEWRRRIQTADPR